MAKKKNRVETRVGKKARSDQRTLRPVNPNDPAANPPATVGQTARSGEVNQLEVVTEDGPAPRGRARFAASPWSGWPDQWTLPLPGRYEDLTDTAWMCLDLNASIISTMPPYATTKGRLTTPPSWLFNPDPDHYTSWNEFAKQAWWDYQMGEVFIICTARFSGPLGPGTGYPARFHVLEPWLVNVEMGSDGLRHYDIGGVDPGEDLLHIRYKSTTSNARGIGPLDVGRTRLVAAALLQRYASRIVESGGVPYYVIRHPEELGAGQIRDLQDQWYESRMNSLGMPAVLSGGIEIEQLQINPEDMALLDLSKYTDSRIAVLLGVPPFLAGLPSGGDSLTYSTTANLFDYHWRAGLKPKVDPVVHAISEWAIPYGTEIELNRDAYVSPGPYERAQTWEILIRNGVLDAAGVQQMERFAISGDMPAEPVMSPIGELI